MGRVSQGAWMLDAGVVCPLGRNALQAAVGLRVGGSSPRATQFSGFGHTPSMHQLWDLPAGCIGYERMGLLAQDALAQLQTLPLDRPLPVLLALPSRERPDDDPARAGGFLEMVADSAGIELDRERSQVVRGSAVDGARLLERGVHLIEQGQVATVLVGGVDSGYHPAVLSQLRERSVADGLDVSDWRVLSEGAGFVLLADRPTAWSERERILGRLCAVATGTIPQRTLEALAADRGADEPPEPVRRSGHYGRRGSMALALARAGVPTHRARAWLARHRLRGYSRPRALTPLDGLPDPTAVMAGLVRQVRQAWPGVSVDWVVSDVDRDVDVVVQWDRVMGAAKLAELPHLEMVRHLGEIGAATAPVAIALAVGQWNAGCAPGRAAVVAIHSGPADRAVALLQELDDQSD